MSGAALSLTGLNKIYNPGKPGEVHAVRDFSMDVVPGEIVALLGSSGCGKTSILRMIAGFEEVTAGHIALGEAEIHTQPPAKRGVAMAFEGYSLYPPLTVGENIAFALKSQRLEPSEVERRVQEIAQLLEIDSVLGRYPSTLSGGQQQRASLGRALIRGANLHLLDEPMGQLEPQLRALLRGRLKHFLKERGLTTILVTHDQTEANALADRIAVMEGGVLQQLATPEELKVRPANLFTGTFIGEPPMNVFEAAPAIADAQLSFQLGDGVVLQYPQSDFSDPLRDALQGSTVTMGVRPHAVRVTDAGAQTTVPATVYANQWLGDQTHVAARFAGGSIVSVLHDRAVYAKNSPIGISIAARDLHIFDRASGRAISHGGVMA